MMTYVYDLILNFNNELYEFYEWKKDDEICHIKKICLVKVSKDKYLEILNNKVSFEDDFLLSIFNKCEYFMGRNINTIPYAFLISDDNRVMAILVDNDGNTIKYSSLLLDEEEDVLDISSRLAVVNLKYHIVKRKRIDEKHTRMEKSIIKYIKKDLNFCYKEGNVNKLKYLYYEYFDKQLDDIDEIYHQLISELDGNFSFKHLNLYHLIRLSYTGKNV